MNFEKMVADLRSEGIELRIDWTNLKLRAKGNISDSRKEFIAKYKQILLLQILGDDATDEQHSKVLVYMGYTQEMADLIVWAWRNDHRWPVEPYLLNVATGREQDLVYYTVAVEDPKRFYKQLTTRIFDSQNGNDLEILPTLKALKLLVEGMGK